MTVLADKIFNNLSEDFISIAVNDDLIITFFLEQQTILAVLK